MQELKPCPHCGGKADIERTNFYSNKGLLELTQVFKISCKKCGATLIAEKPGGLFEVITQFGADMNLRYIKDDREKAAKLWNNRV